MLFAAAAPARTLSDTQPIPPARPALALTISTSTHHNHHPHSLVPTPTATTTTTSTPSAAAAAAGGKGSSEHKADSAAHKSANLSVAGSPLGQSAPQSPTFMTAVNAGDSTPLHAASSFGGGGGSYSATDAEAEAQTSIVAAVLHANQQQQQQQNSAASSALSTTQPVGTTSGSVVPSAAATSNNSSALLMPVRASTAPLPHGTSVQPTDLNAPSASSSVSFSSTQPQRTFQSIALLTERDQLFATTRSAIAPLLSTFNPYRNVRPKRLHSFAPVDASTLAARAGARAPLLSAVTPSSASASSSSSAAGSGSGAAGASDSATAQRPSTSPHSHHTTASPSSPSHAAPHGADSTTITAAERESSATRRERARFDQLFASQWVGAQNVAKYKRSQRVFPSTLLFQVLYGSADSSGDGSSSSSRTHPPLHHTQNGSSYLSLTLAASAPPPPPPPPPAARRPQTAPVSMESGAFPLAPAPSAASTAYASTQSPFSEQWLHQHQTHNRQRPASSDSSSAASLAPLPALSQLTAPAPALPTHFEAEHEHKQAIASPTHHALSPADTARIHAQAQALGAGAVVMRVRGIAKATGEPLIRECLPHITVLQIYFSLLSDSCYVAVAIPEAVPYAAVERAFLAQLHQRMYLSVFRCAVAVCCFL